MKKLVLLASIVALAACSSTPKEEENTEAQPAVTEAAPAPAPEPTPAPEASNDKADSMSADSGANMEGGFPDVEGTERSGATCKNGGDERMVSVIDTREGPCGVVYTKHGSKKTVAYARNDMGFCDKVYSNILGNLTGAGFDCGGAAAAAPAAPAEEKAEESKEESSEQKDSAE